MGRAHWTPEALFGHSGKPLHFTGEITTASLGRILRPSELNDISRVYEVLSNVAGVMASTALTMVVGSAADWSVTNHQDIDILTCLSNRMRRVDFAGEVGVRLRELDGVFIQSERNGSKPFAYVKHFINTSKDSAIDLTFVGIEGWENDEAVEFHRKFNLAFCVI